MTESVRAQRPDPADAVRRPSSAEAGDGAERLIAPDEFAPSAGLGLGAPAGLAVTARRAHGGEADELGGTAVDPAIASVLARRRGAGSALPASVSRPLGDALGADLSRVRVHADSEADQISRSVQAHAFTYGQDVYFTQGAYSPGSAGGQRLLAHELAHVAQGQSGGSGSGSGSGGGPTIGRADDPAEAAADSMADAALASLRRRAADGSAQAAATEAAVGEGDGPSLAPLRRRADLAQDAEAHVVRRAEDRVEGVIRRGFFDDLENGFKGVFNMYPRVVKLGKSGAEEVRLQKEGDQAEAIQIIDELAKTYGIEISAAATIKAIKAQYSRVLATELEKLQGGVWEMKELRGLRAAVRHFAAILGPQRAESTLADKAQGVTTIGRLKQAIDQNSAQGKVDNSTMGEYFGGSSNVGLFDTVTNYADSRYIREGQSGRSNDATLEANAIHEMSHGLIEPIELQNWIAAMDFWTDKYTPSGKPGAELPPTGYGRTGGAGEDLAESVAIFFINRPALKSAAPSREAFLATMVAKWAPAKVEAVVDVSDKAGGGEQAPKVEETTIIKSLAEQTPVPTTGTPPTEQSVDAPIDTSSEKPVEALSGTSS